MLEKNHFKYAMSTGALQTGLKFKVQLFCNLERMMHFVAHIWDPNGFGFCFLFYKL